MLLETLLDCLKDHQKRFSDIQWIGCENFKIPLDNFYRLASKIEDTRCSDVPIDLLVVGNDFWVERFMDETYEERWVFKAYPIEPNKQYTLKTLNLCDLTEKEQERAAADIRSEENRHLAYSELWMMLYKE